MYHLSNPQPPAFTLRALVAALAFAAVLPTHAAPTPTTLGSTADKVLSLNGTWQFAYAANEAEAGPLQGFYASDFASQAFRPTPVPSNWALQGYEKPAYKKIEGEGGQGFYLHKFKVPKDWSQRRVRLHFGGVWDSAEVWLNGSPLGRHDSGFTDFAYDVTGALKPGAENVLAVRVRETVQGYEFDTNDDWTIGGIYRDVTLETMPKDRWLDRVEVETTFDDQFKDGDLKVRVMVGDTNKSQVPRNYIGPGEPYALRLTLLGQDGKTVQSEDVRVPAHYGSGRESTVVLHVREPRKWTAETPALYTLRVELLENGKPVHERIQRVGFRQISTAGGVFRINGQAVKLRGVNRHEEHPDVGRATTREHWLEDLKLMKAANINYIRLAHYPPAEGFLDLCDEMGMYVGDEIPMGFGDFKINDPAYATAVMQRSYETVARDINHPSIVYWSIGNEDPLTSLHMASIRTVKGLDPTRPVLMPWRADLWLPPEIDILAPHYITAQENSELAAQSTRPVIMTEYTHAYGTDGFGGLDDRWKALTQHPTGAGGAIWMWADQGLKMVTRNPDGSLKSELKVIPDGWDGIVDAYRKPTRDYWETKAVYAQVFPAVDRIGFTPGQAHVEIPIRNDFDFIDLKTVKLNWSVREDGIELAAGTANIAGQPHTATPYALPVDAIKATRPGATYFAWISAVGADGNEISRRAVELLPAVKQASPAPAPVVPVVQDGPDFAVKVGNVTYRFVPASAQLSAVDVDGARLLQDMRPTIWRTPNANDSGLVKGEIRKQIGDLEKFTTRATAWKVTRGTDKVEIDAAADYVADQNNRFTVQYRYTIAADGALTVHYTLKPAVQAPWLPHVGMTFSAPDGMQGLRWLGLGPFDAYPNEHAAPILGVWSGTVGTPETAGVKAMRWAELGTGGPKSLKLSGDGYLRTVAGDPHTFQLLSSVAGRGSKGRRPEHPAEQMNVVDGASFSGEFRLMPALRQR